MVSVLTHTIPFAAGGGVVVTAGVLSDGGASVVVGATAGTYPTDTRGIIFSMVLAEIPALDKSAADE